MSTTTFKPGTRIRHPHFKDWHGTIVEGSFNRLIAVVWDDDGDGAGGFMFVAPEDVELATDCQGSDGCPLNG